MWRDTSIGNRARLLTIFELSWYDAMRVSGLAIKREANGMARASAAREAL